MRKLEAATRDASAKTWRERKVMYRIGSYFKGCDNCGQKIIVELPSGREVVRFLSGYDVFRAYQPAASHFTYYCFTCSAKDEKCWPDAKDLGRDAICGSRDAVRAAKAAFRKQHKENSKPAKEEAVDVARDARIAELEERIAALTALAKL